MDWYESNIWVQGLRIPQMSFPDGALNINLPEFTDYVTSVSVVIKGSDDLVALMLVVNALKQDGIRASDLTLEIPYFPYSRQDRVCNPGEARSVQVIAECINSFGFNEVIIFDPHSDVTPALINNVEVIEPLEFLNQIHTVSDGGMNKYTHLVSPDAGAEKKLFELSRLYLKPIIRLSKKCNTLTGEIENTELIDYATKKPGRILIVDDICDGGRTFIEASKVLQMKYAISPENIDLYVTHGLFTKGFDVFKGYFGNIYYTNSLAQNVDSIASWSPYRLLKKNMEDYNVH